ncbi:ABC transporter substrate-binding protein [Tepidiphilus succinatimandens]|mgnify:CR=1 FL=1|uniref:ABC transporter substrate-binding protein n=1 Tax=Tepidiphilus succinatimandens TaxID=224436 RepID=UPI00112F76BD|nr:ABC transporter substrate-binding protein [Tepidiphilus succinatimandens]
MKLKKAWLTAVAAATVWGAAGLGTAQAAEQYLGLPSYRVGPYAAGGTGVFGGWIDYMKLINEREGGVNGVKLVWQECETEYNNARGVECYERLKKQGDQQNVLFAPVSTGITFGVFERVPQDKIPLLSIGIGRSDTADGRVFPWVFPMIATYWSQASAIVGYLGQREGGMDKLKGKKIAVLYLDFAPGKEPFPVLDRLAQKWGFTTEKIAVAMPGNEQQAQWLQIRQMRPDYVILLTYGVSNPTALKTAARTGFPAERIVGWWWSGAEEDVVPAGDAAKGFVAGAFNPAGTDFAVIQDIQKLVYAKGQGDMQDPKRVGSTYYNRGVGHGIIYVEALRLAQEKFGKGKPVTGEQMRWALENLKLDEKRLEAIGAKGLMPALALSCADHEGSGRVRFQQWDGTKWVSVSDWIEPDRKLVRSLVEESAAAYAKEKGITPRDCSKEQ